MTSLKPFRTVVQEIVISFLPKVLCKEILDYTCSFPQHEEGITKFSAFFQSFPEIQWGPDLYDPFIQSKIKISNECQSITFQLCSQTKMRRKLFKRFSGLELEIFVCEMTPKRVWKSFLLYPRILVNKQKKTISFQLVEHEEPSENITEVLNSWCRHIGFPLAQGSKQEKHILSQFASSSYYRWDDSNNGNGIRTNMYPGLLFEKCPSI